MSTFSAHKQDWSHEEEMHSETLQAICHRQPFTDVFAELLSLHDWGD